MKIQWSLILALIFALITAVFAVINVDSVQVNYLFGSVSLPLILLILGCTLLGGIIVGAFGIYRGYRLQKQIKLLNAKLARVKEATGYDPDAEHAAPPEPDTLASSGPANSEESTSPDSTDSTTNKP